MEIKRWLKETARVLRATKRPNKQEFLTISKVTGLGCSVIGLIGFVIFLITQYI
tara:strand:+ start:166 stop:327 length:162 start_codon:yes stop_codon:yes gene_type:complete